MSAKNTSSIPDPLDLLFEMDPDGNEFDQLFLPPEIDEILNELVSPKEPDISQMRPCYNDTASCHRNASEERNQDWSTMEYPGSHPGSQMNFSGATSTTTLHSFSSASNVATVVSTCENAYSKESAIEPDVTADSSVAESSMNPSSMALRNLSNVANSSTEKRRESRKANLERKSQDNLRYNTKLLQLYSEINSLLNLYEGRKNMRRRSQPQILSEMVGILKVQLGTRHFRRRR